MGFRKGDRVCIIQMRSGIFQNLVGMEGKIIGFVESGVPKVKLDNLDAVLIIGSKVLRKIDKDDHTGGIAR